MKNTSQLAGKVATLHLGVGLLCLLISFWLFIRGDYGSGLLFGLCAAGNGYSGSAWLRHPRVR